MSERILEVNDLQTSFYTHLGEVQAVRGVSFSVDRGEVLGIVGESGSGKSVTSMSVIKLVAYPGRIKNGEVIFKGENLVNKTEKQMLNIRGDKISMIFQDPMTSLNPVYRVGNQIVEAITRHQGLNQSKAREKAIEMLRKVGIPSPEDRIDNYPHEFSGGMRQRAMIAIALSCEPDLLIADEPTTALDVTIQAQIMELLRDLKEEIDTSIILITHDLGVVADTCDKISVMYGGLIMESGTAEDIFYDPKHPYTMGLLKSIPRMDLKEEGRLVPITGTPPDLLNPPEGCPFAARCPYTMRICEKEMPKYYEFGSEHKAACWLLDEDAPAVEVDTGVKRGEV